MKGMRLTLLLIMLTAVFSSKAKQAINYYANKAEEALAIGSFQDALDYAHQEIADYVDNPNGYYQAAVSHYGLDQPGMALSMLGKAIKLAKKDREFAARCHLLEAYVYDEMNDSIRALAALENGMKLDPHNKAILTGHCKKILTSEPQRAWKECQKLKTLDPNDPAGFTYSAFLLMNKEEYPQALEEITTAIKLNPDDSYAYALSGLILKRLGYSPDWIRDCLHSAELASDEEATGILLLASAESEEERSDIIEEIEKTKTRYNGYYELEANLLYAWKLWDASAEIWQEMIDMGIYDALTYAMLADCHEKTGRIMDSYAALSSGLHRFPTDPSLKYGKARIGALAGKADEVMQIIDDLIAESPEDPDLYNLKGAALMTKARYADACEPFSIAVILKPTANIRINYADALRFSGQTAKALDEYNELLAMTEEQLLAENQSPQMVYALSFASIGNKEDALRCIKRLAEEQSPLETQTRIRAYSRLGDKQDAIDALRKYSAETKWNPFYDLVTTDLFPLHTEQEFADLLAENGLQTRLNPETHLLEPDVPVLSLSSGGTSLKDFINAISGMTDPIETIKKANEMCPIDAGTAGQIISIDFNEKNKEIVYSMAVPPNTVDFNLLESNPQYKKKKTDIMTLGQIAVNNKMFDMGLAMTYKMKDSGSDTEFTFTITPQRVKELKKLAMSQNEIDRMMLDFWMEEDNLIINQKANEIACPVEYDGKVYSYTYLIPEDEFAQTELFSSSFKQLFAGIFSDLAMRTRLEVFARQGVALKFVYKGMDSGRTIEITYTPEEINENLEKIK